MYATDEPVHLAKILKVGIESKNEKCLKFLFKGCVRKPYAQPSGGKHNKSQQNEQSQTQVSTNL